MEVPPEVEQAAMAAFRADYPDRACSHTRLRAEEVNRYVVAVYSPVGGLAPSPYFIFEILRDGLAARHLSQEERELYMIKNYK
jgi:hypothetical protein